MIYKIFQGDAVVQRIVADENFCRTWCAENGYTYQQELVSVEPEILREPTETEDIAAMMVDHEQRIIMLELELSDTGTEDNNNVETSTATND